ncbi:MAG TPA: formyl transferase [Vulgatibacter sp.]|nr:formyl transferase [Vulgatibacter sp.]
MSGQRVVLLAGDVPSTPIVWARLSRQIPIERILLDGPVPRVNLVKRRAKKLGYLRTASQVAFSAAIVPVLRHAAKERIDELLAELGEARLPENLVTRFDSVNSKACIEALREFDPKVVVVNGTRIISQEVLEATRATFINMHAGITPRYRGVHGAYWALAEGRPEAAGVTVHLVDKGIDTGAVLAQARIQPTDRDNFATYPLLQLQAGLPMLERAVQAALNGEVNTVPPMTSLPSALWHHPTVGQYLVNRFAGRAR